MQAGKALASWSCKKIKSWNRRRTVTLRLLNVDRSVWQCQLQNGVQLRGLIPIAFRDLQISTAE